MLFRTPVRLLILVALLGSMTLSINGASAQSAPNDLIPKVRPVAQNAFKATPAGDVSAMGGQVTQTDPIPAAAPFTDAMLRWQADEPDGASVLVDVRVSADGGAWSQWATADVSDDPLAADEPANTRWSNLLPADLSSFYQIRVTLLPGASGALPTFSNLQVHTVDTRIANEAPPQITTGGEWSTQAVAQPAYVSRTAWGSPDGEGSRAPVGRRAVTHLIVHHTADADTLSSTEPNWAARVRAFWSFHAISRGWGDIGYNWIIDPNGVIYEGRSGSPTDTSAGGAVGFHDTANYGSMGVSLIGTYTAKTPTGAAQNSLVNVLAWKASQRNINPNGSSFYYGCSISTYCAPKVPGSVVPNIAGHRQVTPGHTTCPGDAFMGIMQSIRDRVVARINGAPDNGDPAVDDLESTFSGTGSFHVASCGYGGSTKWTWATNQASQSTNSGTWRPNLRQGGKYKVRVHIPQGCGIVAGREYATTSARYEIGYGGGAKAFQQIDQQTSNDYVELGPFSFDAGTSGYVKLSDLTSEPYTGNSASDYAVFFDAVEWIYQEPVVDARLVEAKLQSTVVPIGGLVQVQFKIRNNGTSAFETQGPDGGTGLNLINGWTFDQSGCFQGSGTNFPKDAGKLRATLGFAEGSATVPTDCAADNGDYPWRWGTRTAIQPGETRTVTGYVRFTTPGTYTFEANLVNEYVRYYGADGAGTSIRLGPVTVRSFPHDVFVPRISR